MGKASEGGGGGLLPDGYTQTEYTQSNGVGFIHTGYTPNSKTMVQCTFQMVDAAGANEAIYGADQFFFFRRASGEYRAATSIAYYDFATDSVNGWHTIIQVPTGAIFTRNNNTPQCGTMTAGSPTVALLLCSYQGSFMAKARISEFKLWEGDVLKQHYIPSIRNSDSRAGFYDIVRNTFLATGWTAGPAV